MKIKKYLYTFIIAVAITEFTVKGQEKENKGMDDMFVHPFLTHMALPDRPDEMSLRLTPYQQRQDSIVERDLALHIEAGLLPGLGIHIRSDGIKTSDKKRGPTKWTI